MTQVHELLAHLSPTKTYARRSILWFDQVAIFKGDERDGTLTIECAKSTKPDSKQVTSDTYAIEEKEVEPMVMGRQFWCVNETSENGDVYQTTIGPVCRCTCDANRAGGYVCKHIDALTELIGRGCLPAKQITCGSGI
jgi:hypothetical protein